VEERGGQKLLVVVAGPMKDPRELDRVVDVGRTVALSDLSRVCLTGELVGLAGKARAGPVRNSGSCPSTGPARWAFSV